MIKGVLEWKERKGNFHVLLQKRKEKKKQTNKQTKLKILILIDLKHILFNCNYW